MYVIVLIVAVQTGENLAYWWCIRPRIIYLCFGVRGRWSMFDPHWLLLYLLASSQHYRQGCRDNIITQNYGCILYCINIIVQCAKHIPRVTCHNKYYCMHMIPIIMGHQQHLFDERGPSSPSPCIIAPSLPAAIITVNNNSTKICRTQLLWYYSTTLRTTTR